MTNAELNFRLQVCAEAGMPYCAKLWVMLAAAWDRGYRAGVDDVESGLGPGAGPNLNPFRSEGAPKLRPEQEQAMARDFRG